MPETIRQTLVAGKAPEIPTILGSCRQLPLAAISTRQVTSQGLSEIAPQESPKLGGRSLHYLRGDVCNAGFHGPYDLQAVVDEHRYSGLFGAVGGGVVPQKPVRHDGTSARSGDHDRFPGEFCRVWGRALL